MDNGSVKIVGLKELGDTLRLLDNAMERKIVQTAARAGAKVIRDEVELRAPRDTGELARNVTVKAYRVSRDGSFKVLVGVKYVRKNAAKGAKSTEAPGAYAFWVEFGRPGKSGHTHQAAHPFIRPGFDAKKDEAARVFGDKVMEGIRTELRQ